MSDQVYGNPEAEDSYEADIDTGFDSAEETAAAAGGPGRALPQDQDDVSHHSDLSAGYDDHGSGASEDDKLLGLR